MQNRTLSKEDIANLKKISSWSYRFYILYLMIVQKEDSVLCALQSSIGNYPSYIFRKLYKLHLAEEAFNKVKEEPYSLQTQKKLERAEKRLMSEAVKYSVAKLQYIKKRSHALYLLKDYFEHESYLIDEMKLEGCRDLGVYEDNFYTYGRITKYASHSVINSANLQNDGIGYEFDSPGLFLVKEKFNHIESLDNNFHVAVHFAKDESRRIRNEIKEIDIDILNVKAIQAKKEYNKYYEKANVFKYLFHKLSYYLRCLQLCFYDKKPISYDTYNIDFLKSLKNDKYKSLKSFNSYSLFFNSEVVKKQFVKKVLQDEKHIKEKIVKVRANILKDSISQRAIDIVDKMLVEFNMTQDYAAEFLSVAAGKGQEEMFLNLLTRQCISQHIDNYYFCSALLCAIKGNHCKLVDFMINTIDSQGVSGVSGHENNTALISAAANGHYQIVDWLLKFLCIDVNIQDNKGFTALMMAAMSGHNEVVDLLLKQPGIDVNICCAPLGSALSYAAYNGNIRIVNQLLEHTGIDINIKHQGTKGGTALIAAAKEGNYQILCCLLECSGIDVNIQSGSGKTALIWAAKNNHDKILVRLLECSGIDVNIQCNEGKTALMWAAASNSHNKIVEHLLKHPGINVNIQCNKGRNALSYAVCGNNKTLRSLIKFPGIDLNIQNMYGWSALYYAFMFGRNVSASILLSNESCDYGEIGILVNGSVDMSKYMLFTGRITFEYFKKIRSHEYNFWGVDIKEAFVKKIEKKLLFLESDDGSRVKWWQKKPSRVDTLTASIVSESFSEATIEKYSGMKMSRFVAVRELMRFAKITKIIYKFNDYIFINMLMLRNNSSSIFEDMPFDIKTYLLEFIIGEGVSEIYKAVRYFEKDKATSSVSLLEHSYDNSCDTKSVSTLTGSDNISHMDIYKLSGLVELTTLRI